MLRRLDTLRVIESSICFSDCRRFSFFSVSSREDPREWREREEGGGGERSMRGSTLTLVQVPEPVSFCGVRETERERGGRGEGVYSE
jgi:hypothetical protein